jgi:hypothetical protein
MTAPLAIDPTTSSRTLRIRPRAALLAIHADALLEDPYRVEWRGAEPTVDDRGRSVEVGYTAGARLRALTPRRGSLSVALIPMCLGRSSSTAACRACGLTCATCSSRGSPSPAAPATSCWTFPNPVIG